MAEYKKIAPPSKYHGGKSSLADWIVSLMPPRCENYNNPSPKDKGWCHYVEPYCGMANVALAMNPEGVSEVINDLNLEVTNFWKTLQDKRAFEEFRELCEKTPFSFVEWADSDIRNTRPRIPFPNVDSAHAYFIAIRQSLAGRMDSFASITRNRTRRGMNEQVSAWLSSVEGLPEVHARIKRWLILNAKAVDVIRQQDGPRTLFYLDPPYLHETRASKDVYGDFEMSPDEHEELLTTLSKLKGGRFLLSGYRSKLYDKFAKKNKWKLHEKEIPNSAAGGKEKRIMTECLYCNF